MIHAGLLAGSMAAVGCSLVLDLQQPTHRAETGGMSGTASSGSGGGTGGHPGPTGSGGTGAGGTSTGGSMTTTVATSSSTSGGPDCATGSVCVPSITSGEYAVEAPAANQACPAGWSGAANYTDGTDPGCNACACSAPVDTQCFAPSLDIHGQPDCSDATIVTIEPSTCFMAAAPLTGGVASPAQVISQGYCNATAVTVTPKPPVEMTVCTVPSAGSGTCHNQPGTCVPDSAGTFGKTCILLPGQVSCPAGWASAETVKTLMGDSRTCTCGCGAAAGATCMGAVVDLYAGTMCGNTADQTLTPGSACASISISGGSYSSVLSVAGTVHPGSCTAQSTEGGALQVGSAQTICCLP
jgi:hypothetical protein